MNQEFWQLLGLAGLVFSGAGYFVWVLYQRGRDSDEVEKILNGIEDELSRKRKKKAPINGT